MSEELAKFLANELKFSDEAVSRLWWLSQNEPTVCKLISYLENLETKKPPNEQPTK